MSIDKDWFELPGPIAGKKLIEMRDELRAKNLHDTEEPPLETRDGTPRPRRATAHQRRHVQRPAVPAHGQRRRPLRPQRAAERDVPGHRQPDEPEPADRQPRAADAHDVPARDDRQRAGGGVDPVPGARLVRAQEGCLEPHARHPARGRRHLARAADARAGDAGRYAEGGGLERGRRRTSTRTRTGGTARRSTARPPPSRRRCGSAATARCWSGPTASSASTRSAGREITGFTENSWVGLSLLHGLFALEHNAICDMLGGRTRRGTTSGCSSRRGSSTPR